MALGVKCQTVEPFDRFSRFPLFNLHFQILQRKRSNYQNRESSDKQKNNSKKGRKKRLHPTQAIKIIKGKRLKKKNALIRRNNILKEMSSCKNMMPTDSPSYKNSGQSIPLQSSNTHVNQILQYLVHNHACFDFYTLVFICRLS